MAPVPAPARGRTPGPRPVEGPTAGDPARGPDLTGCRPIRTALYSERMVGSRSGLAGGLPGRGPNPPDRGPHPSSAGPRSRRSPDDWQRPSPPTRRLWSTATPGASRTPPAGVDDPHPRQHRIVKKHVLERATGLRQCAVLPSMHCRNRSAWPQCRAYHRRVRDRASPRDLATSAVRRRMPERARTCRGLFPPTTRPHSIHPYPCPRHRRWCDPSVTNRSRMKATGSLDSGRGRPRGRVAGGIVRRRIVRIIRTRVGRRFGRRGFGATRGRDAGRGQPTGRVVQPDGGQLGARGEPLRGHDDLGRRASRCPWS